jgi:hypothetical protein
MKNISKRPRSAPNEKLIRALQPFVEAYVRAASPIGDSDLYNEQPREVFVTIGDCRRAHSVLLDVGSDADRARIRAVVTARNAALKIK